MDKAHSKPIRVTVWAEDILTVEQCSELVEAKRMQQPAPWVYDFLKQHPPQKHMPHYPSGMGAAIAENLRCSDFKITQKSMRDHAYGLDEKTIYNTDVLVYSGIYFMRIFQMMQSIGWRMRCIKAWELCFCTRRIMQKS